LEPEQFVVAAEVLPHVEPLLGPTGHQLTAAMPVDAGTAPAPAAAGAAPERASIRIATYNIRSGCEGRLEMALRVMNQMDVDIGILTETKLTDGIHMRQSSGYQVYTTLARSHSQT
jgi:hypothetical protein